MELWQVRYFVAVAEELSFRGAAARLNVSQPPISRAVAKLEEELGATLFVRGAGRIAMTDSGRGFLREGRALLAQADRAIGVARGHPATGEAISIGFEGSSIYSVVPRAVGRLRGEHPELAIALADMTTPDQVRALLAGEIDAGFVVPPVQHPRLIVTEIWRDELVAVLPAAHAMAGQSRVRLADLAEEAFVIGSRQDQCGLHLSILALCRASGFVPHVAIDVNDVALVSAFVSSGIGLALLPRSAIFGRSDVAAVPLRPRASTGLSIAHRRCDGTAAVHALTKAASAFGRGHRPAPAT